MRTEAIVCKDVRLGYQVQDGKIPVLRGVDLTVPPGVVAALSGPSGSGKSSLLRVLGCLDRVDGGEVIVGGRDASQMSSRQRRRLRARRVGFVYQNPVDNLIDHLTVRQHLRLAAQMRRTKLTRREADALLERFGLERLSGQRPHRLSGGEQQRAAVAFAAVGSPAVLIADEPTGQLDHDNGARVIDIFEQLAEEGVTVVVATHDVEVAKRAHETIRLRDGKVVA